MSEGIIKDIRAGQVTVEISCQSACGNCLQKHSCTLRNTVLKSIEIETPDAEVYKIGEKVNIELSERDKRLSLFFAYILPLCLIVCSLSILSYFQYNDTQNAIGSLIILGGYYVLLKIFHKHLRKHIRLTLHRNSVD